jgi:type VI secretion system VasD/TssJ family lipoprotein
VPRRIAHILLAIAMVAALLPMGCGGKDTPTPDAQLDWSFEPGAIRIRVKADEQLNLYRNEAHTLALCLYQLATPDAFKDKVRTVNGVTNLLDCQRFDPSVVTAKRIIVQPGEDRTIFMDRAEKVRHLGLAAGYFELDPAAATRLYPVPIEERDEGFLFSDIVRTPGKLFVNLFLGPREIQTAGAVQ